MKHEAIEKLIAPLVDALDLELIGMEFAPHRGNALLRLYIDAKGRPVTIEDCEAVSRATSAALDAGDPIEGRYTLEVSSPGLDRPLFSAAQFERYLGQDVKLTVNVPVGGRRRFQGPIRSVRGERIAIEQDGNEIEIEHGNVLKANLVPEFRKAGAKVAPRGKPAKPVKPARKQD